MTQQIIRKAIFSEDRKYRYVLSRYWGSLYRDMWADPLLSFVLLNPSTANEVNDDPTVSTCINFAFAYGYKGVQVLNLFALVSSAPSVLLNNPDAIGPENDTYLTRLSLLGDKIIAGWGNQGAPFPDRIDQVVHILTNCRDVYCLYKTKAGQPRHPLYVPVSVTIVPQIYSPFRGKRISYTKEARP